MASRFRRLLGKYLRLDLAGLGPEDRLFEDLRIEDFDSMATAELLIDVEKEFGIEIKDSDASELKNSSGPCRVHWATTRRGSESPELAAAKVTEGGEPTTPLQDVKKELGLNE